MIVHTFDEKKKKPVKAGEIKDGEFHRKVKNEHFMKKEHGYGIQRDVLQTLLTKGINTIVIHAKNTKLTSQLADWINYGRLADYGHGYQVFLSTEGMKAEKL